MLFQRSFDIVKVANLSILINKRLLSQSTALRNNSQIYKPNNLEKRFLVWTGKYKTINDVPSLVNPDVMERSRNRIRIRLANIMMGLTVIGCCIMIYSGKSAAKRGESLVKQNLEWHEMYNKQKSKE